MSGNHRLAIVTGAAGGIGVELVEALLRAGYSVAAWDKNVDSLDGHIASLKAEGQRVTATKCDVSSEADVEGALKAAVEAFGAPHLLVNNAATRHNYALESLPRAAWDLELAVNLTGVFQCTQSVGRLMLAEGAGVIVNMSSVTANMGLPMRGAYTPSKAGILGLTYTTAVEWGPRGIRCNAISPGMIATPVHDATYQDPGLRKKRAESVPLGRVGNGTDVADVVVFLASDAARFVNGADIPVDGGLARALIALLPVASGTGTGAFTTQLEQIHGKARHSAPAGAPGKANASQPGKN